MIALHQRRDRDPGDDLHLELLPGLGLRTALAGQHRDAGCRCSEPSQSRVSDGGVHAQQ